MQDAELVLKLCRTWEDVANSSFGLRYFRLSPAKILDRIAENPLQCRKNRIIDTLNTDVSAKRTGILDA